MRILGVQAKREVDRQAIDELGIPGVVLMENAALGVVEAALAEAPAAESALVYCGPGNNGGDGLAVARHLAVRGLRVVAVVANGGTDYSGDARVQFETARNMAGMGLELRELAADAPAAELATDGSPDLVIDALFGSGLSRPLEGQFAELVQAINRFTALKVAVDLPSGLHGDRPRAPGPHVRADLSVTFGAPCPAHIFAPASRACGRVAVADLGFPRELLERADGDLHLLAGRELAPLAAPRPVDAHKGDFGHLLLVGGSSGKSGAAVLAARAAVRTGAGLVTAAVPEPILEVVEGASLETMSAPLPVSAAGELSETSREALRLAAVGKDAVALGPGLGTSSGTAEVIRWFCRQLELPLVLDADGLTVHAGHLEELAERQVATVLTPHPGEMSRLLERPVAEVADDRPAAAREAARRANAVVVLKGQLSLIADPRGGVYVNPTGNPGMATGGTGDVLTGMIGALLAQGLDGLSAALLGTFVHGLAGDRASEVKGERSMAAGDLLSFLPQAFRELEENEVLGESGAGPRS